MSIPNTLIAVLLMALVTYIPRALPVVVFRREIKSRFLKSFLHYVPYAVLGGLTFPDVFYSTGSTITAIGGVIVALFLAWREKSLVIVATGAIITVSIISYFL